MNQNIKKASEEIQAAIIQDYKNNVSLRELERKYHITRNSIAAFLEEQNIKTTYGNHYRKYFHNENYFEKIDTSEKAYWLGFLFADGYILDTTGTGHYGQDKVGLSVAADSKDALEKFRASIQATNPITWEEKTNCQSIGRILLTSQKTVNDLIDKGCVKQKTLILRPPQHMPEEFTWHFIRGFFDGDGSLACSSSKKSKVAIYNLNFTTTYEMAYWLQQQFEGKGSIYPEKRREHTWYFNIGGNRQVIHFCKKMYNDATVYLDRKYNRYLELLEKYGESQGVNE